MEDGRSKTILKKSYAYLQIEQTMQGEIYVLLKAQLKEVIFMIFRGFWSDNEDYELIKLFLKYGRKWSKMTQYI